MTVPLDLNGPRTQEFESWPDAWVDCGIIPRFDSIVARHAHCTAINDGARHLSYAQLSTTARHLAARIVAECPPGTVGILQSHSAAFWVAILACIGAGRAYAALDLHHPASRNAGILRDAGLAAVIVPPDFDAEAQAIPRDLLRIPWVLRDGTREAPYWPRTTVPAADVPAVVLYTSGSTGRPKGIANNQQALLQRVAQYVNASHLHSGDRMLTLSSPCTIAGTREGLTALLTGATLHIIDAHRTGLGAIARRLHDARITALNAVPSMLRALADAPDSASTLRSLRTVRVGGEVVFWTDIALLRRALPDDCCIQIGYSSTEATGTQWFVPRDATLDGPFVPVGYVLPGNTASVVDDAGQLLPRQQTGELVLRSRFIALGLWQNGRCIPDSMRPDPHHPDERVLHTGDLVHMDANGLCTVTGRKDRQVKVNGVRVEPSEVEAALRGLAQVADAAVIARSSDNATSLVAFVVPRTTCADLRETDIRASLRAGVPAAMQPARIHRIETMPRLPSGKLDVNALREFDQAPVDTQAAAAPARQTAEAPALQAVQQAWRSTLGRRALEDNLSFQEAGGDSLKLMQLVLWLETLLDRRLPLDLFTQDMRVAEVAAALQQTAVSSEATEADWRPRVCLFPGLDGDEPRLAQFRSGLQQSIRFTLIEYPDWPDMVRCGYDFAALVNAAVSQITAHEPSGRLLLAGYSFGGDVAFGAALRLRELGRDVGFLGILDTDLERVTEAAAAYRQHPPLQRVRQWLGEIAYDRLHAGPAFLLSKCMREVIGLERSLRYADRWRPLLPQRLGFAFDRRTRLILRVHARWRWHATVSRRELDVPTVLFRSAVHSAEATPDLGWRLRCQALQVIDVDGNHHTMLDAPHRTMLCDRFAEAVRHAAAQTPCSGHDCRGKSTAFANWQLDDTHRGERRPHKCSDAQSRAVSDAD